MTTYDVSALIDEASESLKLVVPLKDEKINTGIRAIIEALQRSRLTIVDYSNTGDAETFVQAITDILGSARGIESEIGFGDDGDLSLLSETIHEALTKALHVMNTVLEL